MADHHQIEPLHQWKEIEGADPDAPSRTFRMRVPGGWLYRYSSRRSNVPLPDCMAFVPKAPEH